MSEIKPVYQLKMGNGSWIDQERGSYEYNVKHGHETRILYPAAAYEALLKKLPEGMEKCTIQFKECSKGHGWLTATNWVQHDCSACRLEALQKENAELKEDLQFVERWANHHGTKPNITAQEALSCIQHYPSVLAVTKSYKDGVIPDTRNPYAEIEALKSAKTNVIRALGGRYKEIIELRKHNASQTNRIFGLEAAVKANHEWHQEHDDYDGYQESALYTTNTSTLSASKNGAENGK